MSIIKSFSVGNGDMFYIKHSSDNFTIIDCCMDDTNKKRITHEIKAESKNKGIVRFISTHPDEDHFRGLEYLDDQIGVVNFYCVENNAIKEVETPDFKRYLKLKEGEYSCYLFKNIKRNWLNGKDEFRGSSGITILWPDTSNAEFKQILQTTSINGTNVNNLSPVIKYSVNQGVNILWMGDMEYTFLEKIKDQIDWPEVDILFAPHHGRDSGKVPEDVLKKLNPYIIVIGEAPSNFLNYYSNYNTIKQNSAGDITFECIGNHVNVYVSNPNYRYNTSFLEKLFWGNGSYSNYLGSFKVKGDK